MGSIATRTLGWHPDVPDFRDYDPKTPAIKRLLEQLDEVGSSRTRHPSKVDLREYFPAAYDQKSLHASTSHACIGLYEYFQRRSFGKASEPSRLFLHKTTRKTLGLGEGSAVSLRACLKAMKNFGVPPETLWTYDVDKHDEEPEAFLYSFAREYASTNYLRLASRNSTGSATLKRVKAFLAAGFPAVFGLPVLSSLTECDCIPYRPTFDFVRGGHAMVVVGYNDRHMKETKGALLVRNSWGRSWGEDGYGWLPYAYVEQQLAIDFWTLIRPDWVESREFERPRLR